MDPENVSQEAKILETLKKNSPIIALIVIGLGFISYGIFDYIKPKESSFEFSSNEEVKGVEVTSSEIRNISVDIQGEVKSPGVYELKDGARIKDALLAAGGLSSNADSDYVSKRINQAQKLADGQKIYIPAVGEDTSNLVLSTNLASSESQSGLTGINSASKSKLEALPKIGPVTADKIIAARPYAALEELVSKKAVTQKVFEEIKALIDLN